MPQPARNKVPKHTILFLAANPPGTGRLALDQEARDIEVELERTGWRDHFELVTRWAAEPLDLLRELRKIRPTVLHFSGHGGRGSSGSSAVAAGRREVSVDVEAAGPAMAQHGLYLHDKAGGIQFVPAGAIAQTLEAAGQSVRLVVLNACYTTPIAKSLLAHVDCVVGMSGAILDDAARSFSIGFYGGLGERQSIDAAFLQGRAAISLGGLTDAERPQLQVRAGVDAHELILAAIPPSHAAARASATLIGMVSLHREHGTPISGVAISAMGANPTVSGADGTFVLSFPQGYPGQNVRVIVNRPSWDVVNAILLDQRLPDDSGARPLEIILCPSDERERWVADFYRVKADQAVEQTYKAKLEALEQRHADTAQERDRLLRERDDARKQVDEWARQAAARAPDEVGGIYREALRLFIDGKTDAALELLSDDRLQREADQAKAQLDRAKQQLDQVVQGWLLKGQLLTSKFDYAAAAGAYDKAVASAPGSFDAWFAYAYFHRQQNQFAQARRGYEQALLLARLASKDADVAMTLNNLGLLSSDENRNADARQQYQEALDLFRSLAKTNPAVYLPDVATTLNNLGVLSSAENRNADARQQYQEALDIRRSLAKTNPAVYLPYVANTLNNLGLLNRAENRNADARQQYQEALDLYRSLAKTNPAVYLPYVATTLNNLGILSRDENRNADARQQYQEALDIRRSLAKTNPAVYLPYVATTLNNLGILSSDENRNADARQQYQEALDLYRSLANTNPAVYLPYVAMTLNNLGNLSSAENRNADARQQYQEALDIRRSLAKTNPAVYLPDVAMTLNNLGVLSRAENRNADARQQFQEALDLYRSLANTNPAVYLPYVAMTLNNLGILSSAENRYADARQQYQEALDIRRSLANTNPAVYLPYVATTLWAFGLLNQAENRNAEARKQYEEALGIFRQFAALAPSAYQPRVDRLEQLLRELP